MSKRSIVARSYGHAPSRRQRQAARAGLSPQRGFVLIATLLLLIVMSILAVGMFRGVDVQEMIAGNLREKQRSLQAAIDAEQAAEYWLSTGGNALAPTAVCNSLVNGNTGTVQACSNILSQVAAGGVTQVPWSVGGNADVGFTYNPGTSDIVQTSAGGANTYYGLPRFYISFLGNASLVNPQPIYQIDAWSYAATTGTVSEVESTWQVTQVVNSGIQGGSTGN